MCTIILRLRFSRWVSWHNVCRFSHAAIGVLDCSSSLSHKIHMLVTCDHSSSCIELVVEPQSMNIWSIVYIEYWLRSRVELWTLHLSSCLERSKTRDRFHRIFWYFKNEKPSSQRGFLATGTRRAFLANAHDFARSLAHKFPSLYIGRRPY